LIAIILASAVLSMAYICFFTTAYAEISMDSQLISQGLDLMLYGMGTVFVFLTVLVVITTFMSTTVAKFAQQPDPDIQPQTSSAQVEPRIVQAIQAALNKHRGV
jgi:oxaloacetate decarboxylase gamma subunit